MLKVSGEAWPPGPVWLYAYEPTHIVLSSTKTIQNFPIFENLNCKTFRIF